MSVTTSVMSLLRPSQLGPLGRVINAMRPHPLRNAARQEISALQNGLEAFAERYGLDDSSTGAGERATNSGAPPIEDHELDEQLRGILEQASAYLTELEAGKLPREVPNFAQLVADLEDGGSRSLARLTARAELAGLLRKIDLLDNHWLAEARRNRRRRRPRVARDMNHDNIDDTVQRRQVEPELSPRSQLSNAPDSTEGAEALMAQAARRRDELASRLGREQAELGAERDELDDEPPIGYTAFWNRYGHEATLLLIALEYVGEGVEVATPAAAAELLKLPPNVPPQQILERLRSEFEGRYLPFGTDYDVAILEAVASGMPIADAVLLSQQHALKANGTLNTTVMSEPEPAVRAQAAMLEHGTPPSIQERAPWRPMDPLEVARGAHNVTVPERSLAGGAGGGE